MGDLIGFHVYLMSKGRSTYAHIMLKRKHREEKYREAEVDFPRVESQKCKPEIEIKAHRQTSSETKDYFSSPNLKKKNFLSSDKILEGENPVQASKKHTLGSKDVAKLASKEEKDRMDTIVQHPDHEIDGMSYDYKDNIFSKRTQVQEVFNEDLSKPAKAGQKLELADSSPSQPGSRQPVKSRLDNLRPEVLDIEKFKQA